jgi:hypothetical protein
MVSPTVEKLLTISRAIVHTPYQDDNVLSVTILAFVGTVALALLTAPLLLATKFFLKGHSRAKRIVEHIQTVIGVIISLLFGAQIIFFFVMTSFGGWYIGGPLLLLFWSLCFLILNRKAKEDQYGYKQQLNEDEVSMYHGPQGFTSKIKSTIGNYGNTVLRGVKDRSVFTFIMLTAITIFSIAASLSVCNVCVTYSPIEFSTSLTRKVFGQGKICNYNQICYSYLTVPEDMSTSMIINYQYYGYKPLKSYVQVYQSPESPKTNFTATCFRMNNILDEERYQCWADALNLQPGTTYYYKPFIVVSGQDPVTLEESKFRTGPSRNSTEGYTFTTGGDLEWSQAGIELAAKAANSNPLFGMVGGDIAYANGDPHCYRRWDQWFTHWQTKMVTSDGYTIPILTCIGNHEAGNFMMPKWRNGFYMRYFPHQIGLQSVNPQERPLTHYHLFSSHSMLLTLDSWVHLTPAEQTSWLNQTLARFSSLRNKFALYHISMYPSKVNIDEQDKTIIEAINRDWKPSFDHYGLTVGFENHFHCYKTTHPVRQDQKVEKFKGTRYLGDGAWGQRSRLEEVFSTSPLIKQVKNEAHIFVIRAENDQTVATSYYFDYNTNTVQVLEDDLVA